MHRYGNGVRDFRESTASIIDLVAAEGAAYPILRLVVVVELFFQLGQVVGCVHTATVGLFTALGRLDGVRTDELRISLYDSCTWLFRTLDYLQ